jgi:hypothetical protein
MAYKPFEHARVYKMVHKTASAIVFWQTFVPDQYYIEIEEKEERKPRRHFAKSKEQFSFTQEKGFCKM